MPLSECHESQSNIALKKKLFAVFYSLLTSRQGTIVEMSYAETSIDICEFI